MLLQYISNDAWVQLGFVLAVTVIIVLSQIHHYWLQATMMTKPLQDLLDETRRESSGRINIIHELRAEITALKSKAKT